MYRINDLVQYDSYCHMYAVINVGATLAGYTVIIPPPPWGGGIKRCFFVWRLSVWCLSVAYIGPNSRIERPRNTTIGTITSRHTSHMTIGHQFQRQRSKVKGQLVVDVSNSQHAGIGATWRINTKILSTCRARRHIVLAVRLHVTACLMTGSNPSVRAGWKIRYQAYKSKRN